jgi:hypothetical protein
VTDEAAFAATPGPTDLLPEPLAPEAATARIAELKKDPAFLERYLGGEVKANEEFKRLHSMASKNPVNESGIHRSSQLDTLKKHADLPQQCWDQVSNNGAVAQFERDEALRTKERCMRDRAFIARYLDGSREEVSLMTQISLILASPVKTEGS